MNTEHAYVADAAMVMNQGKPDRYLEDDFPVTYLKVFACSEQRIQPVAAV